MTSSMMGKRQEERGDLLVLMTSSWWMTCLYASHVVRAVLHATFSSELQPFDSSVGPTVLKATSMLAAYSPLVVHQAEHGNEFGGYWVNLEKLNAGTLESSYTGLDELYLVSGSEMDVLLLGGPEKWSDKVEYVENVQVLGEQDVPIPDGVLVQSSSGDARLYKVLCQTLEKFKLLFSRGDLFGDDHPIPHQEKVELSIICDFPSSITLIANEPGFISQTIKLGTQVLPTYRLFSIDELKEAIRNFERTSLISEGSLGKCQADILVLRRGRRTCICIINGQRYSG